MHKKPFDIDEVMARIRDAVAAVSRARRCSRWRDEGLSLAVRAARRVHHLDPHPRRGHPADGAPALRRRPHAARMSPAAGRHEIDALIQPATFHEPKAEQIHAIARARRWRSSAASCPCDADVLPVVRRRRAEVRQPRARHRLRPACAISVDIHVHRVTNRWGYVAGRDAGADDARAGGSAARTLLDRDQPPARAVRQAHLHRRPAEVLDLPVLDMCRQVGITSHR